MRHVLVTGGAGFIGSHVVEALLREGDRVRVLDNLSTGRRENLTGPRAAAELRVGDLRDPETVRQAVAGTSHVLHLAALPSVARSVADPMSTHEVNSTGTLRLLEACRQAGVRRFAQASSSSVYGDQEAEVKEESMVPRPLSPYAVSKLTAEHYAAVYHQLHGLETVSLRYFNVFGPRQDPNSEYSAVIPRFIDRVRRGVAPVIYGDGEQARDFTYIDNVVQANLRALDAPGIGGGVFNVAVGRAVSINQLVAAIGRLAGREVRAEHAPARAGDVRHSLADVSRGRKRMGYDPAVDFDSGLERTWQSFIAG